MTQTLELLKFCDRMFIIATCYQRSSITVDADSVWQTSNHQWSNYVNNNWRVVQDAYNANDKKNGH